LARSSATNASEAARRYASALFELASANKEVDAVGADLKAFLEAVTASEDLQRLLESPAFSREDKIRALLAIAEKAGYKQTTGHFFGTMAQNGRTRDLPDAISCFDELLAAQRGITRVTARTAAAMSDDQRAALEKMLAESVDSEVELQTDIDPDLIGGLQLLIGSTLIDASLATKLDRMNIAMKGA